MSDSEQQEKITNYIDGWMVKLNARAKELQYQGISVEEALDRATDEIRMQIRRAPPVEL